MSNTYNLVFVNNSDQTGSACVYQQLPNLDNPNIMSLAWFAEVAAPTTTIVFSWQITYSFVWDEIGTTLAPGVMFTASQNWPADLTSSNQVGFTDASGAYTFENQTVGPVPGQLTIQQDNTIVPDQVAVGIGMSGSGTFVLPGEPNMNYTFVPTPTYWITFGTYTPGLVLDISTITNSSYQVTFPENIYSMTATLGGDNIITVGQTGAANAAFVAARKKNRRAVWGARA